MEHILFSGVRPCTEKYESKGGMGREYIYIYMPTGWIRSLGEMHGSEHYCYDADGLYAPLTCSVHVLEGVLLFFHQLVGVKH